MLCELTRSRAGFEFRLSGFHRVAIGSELVVVYTASDNQQHRGAALLCRRGGTARTRAILTCVASLCPCDASVFRCSVSLCCWGGAIAKKIELTIANVALVLGWRCCADGAEQPVRAPCI